MDSNNSGRAGGICDLGKIPPPRSSRNHLFKGFEGVYLERGTHMGLNFEEKASIAKKPSSRVYGLNELLGGNIPERGYRGGGGGICRVHKKKGVAWGFQKKWVLYNGGNTSPRPLDETSCSMIGKRTECLKNRLNGGENSKKKL